MTANSSAHGWVRGSPWLGRDPWLLQWGGRGGAERESWSQVAPRYRHRVRMELQSDRVGLQSDRVGPQSDKMGTQPDRVWLQSDRVWLQSVKVGL